MIKKLLILLLIPFIGLGQNPNYSEHVAPIIYNKCLKCHHNGGIATLSLETYANTVSNVGMIQHVTSTGEMPPWPPDTLYQNYAYQNTLSLSEITTIIDWISNGSPLGNTALLPTMPTFSNTSPFGTPDLELQMPTYASTATTNSDDYVCFSIPTGLLQTSSVSLAMHYPEGSLGQLDSTKVRFYFYPQSTVIREISSDFLINEGLFGPPFYLPPNQITEITGSYGPIPVDVSLMSVFPHMHLLGKDIICYAVTPTNDTINLIKINHWDFEWQGTYLFEKFIKIPSGSMIYAKGNYDNNTPLMVQSGFNTTNEMFIVGFQYLPYQFGDENISIETPSIATNTNSVIVNSSRKKLLKISDVTGKEVYYKKNTPLLYIYDDGTVEKRLTIE